MYLGKPVFAATLKAKGATKYNKTLGATDLCIFVVFCAPVFFLQVRCRNNFFRYSRHQWPSCHYVYTDIYIYIFIVYIFVYKFGVR